MKVSIGITSDFQEQLPGVILSVCQEVFDRHAAWIEYDFFPTSSVAQAKQIDKFDAIVTYHVIYPADVIEELKRLTILSRWGVGYDSIDVEACTRSGVALLTVPRNVVSSQVASGIISMMYALATKLLQKDRLVRQHRWHEKISYLGTDLSEKTLGSIGVGNIGSELFRRAASLGFDRFVGTDPYVSEMAVNGLGVELVDLDTLLRVSDVVSINCPLTHETRGMISQREFALMKPSALLINTARGPIVDEHALINALRNEQIAGAAIDVFWEEPLPRGHPIIDQENLILSPHSIAFTDRLVKHNSWFSCHNIVDLINSSIGSRLVNVEVVNNLSFRKRMSRLRNIARSH